ncbi:hypothetical protein T4B_11840 [Trichinella pseudospiralis]|uniref:Uncharacterized protein n=1 Tax=Trichinella pseudospiralis TaxID=6337 RepID=A0A0V1H101_TRIPS|nr:hypothetical protein T4B_13019 [Trichinella pseudospiralis]KRZ19722.1 hypothetical protein T4B_11840 [Trichinella pseudospiralis]
MDYAKLNRRRNCLKGRMNRLCQDLDALVHERESRIEVKMTLDSIFCSGTVILYLMLGRYLLIINPQ